MAKKEMLELRKKIKSKKPKFSRQDTHKKARLAESWRKPRGRQSKMRLGFKDYKRSVKKGWGSPNEVKGLDKSGLKPVAVSTLKELNNINASVEGALFSSKLGLKKKIQLYAEAIKIGVKVLNVADAEKYLADLKQRHEDNKKSNKEKQTKRKDSKKKAEEKKDSGKKKEDKKESAEEAGGKDKKALEKKEMDKVLTKRT